MLDQFLVCGIADLSYEDSDIDPKGPSGLQHILDQSNIFFLFGYPLFRKQVTSRALVFGRMVF